MERARGCVAEAIVCDWEDTTTTAGGRGMDKRESMVLHSSSIFWGVGVQIDARDCDTQQTKTVWRKLIYIERKGSVTRPTRIYVFSPGPAPKICSNVTKRRAQTVKQQQISSVAKMAPGVRVRACVEKFY
jgi:hypothetical protein